MELPVGIIRFGRVMLNGFNNGNGSGFLRWFSDSFNDLLWKNILNALTRNWKSRQKKSEYRRSDPMEPTRNDHQKTLAANINKYKLPIRGFRLGLTCPEAAKWFLTALKMLDVFLGFSYSALLSASEVSSSNWSKRLSVSVASKTVILRGKIIFLHILLLL